jgi:hypothetical protein
VNEGNPIMQMSQSAGVGGPPIVIEPECQQGWGFVNSSQDEVQSLLKPGGDRKRMVVLVAGALLVGLGLGWLCATSTAVFDISQTETPRRLPEIKPAGKSDGGRRTSSVSPAEAPLAKAVSSVGTSANTAPAARELVAVPETRPTTIAGWTVLEVRGGTVVLEGPDGVRTAARGDIVPGIGRIDSIVRWGNRWIVATASGLIADP